MDAVLFFFPGSRLHYTSVRLARIRHPCITAITYRPKIGNRLMHCLLGLPNILWESVWCFSVKGLKQFKKFKNGAFVSNGVTSTESLERQKDTSAGWKDRQKLEQNYFRLWLMTDLLTLKLSEQQSANNVLIWEKLKIHFEILIVVSRGGFVEGDCLHLQIMVEKQLLWQLRLMTWYSLKLRVL